MDRPRLDHDLVAIALVAASWAVMAWYYPQLPASVPTHWGMDGKPNGWMPLPYGALWGPALTTFMYGLMTALPHLDPRAAGWDDAPVVYGRLRRGLTAFGLYTTGLALHAAARPDAVLFDHALLLGMGLLFTLLGNMLPQMRSNFFMGIRTPWTLSDETNWERTHRMAGRLMVAAGLLTMAVSFAPMAWAVPVMIAALVAACFVPVGYSYYLFRR